MSETEELHKLVALLDGGVDPSGEQSLSKLIQIMDVLNAMPQAELDDLLQLLGISPGAVRHLAGNARHHLDRGKQDPCVNGVRLVRIRPSRAALVKVNKGCDSTFSLAREVAHGFRSSGRRMERNQRASTAALPGNGNSREVRGKHRPYKGKVGSGHFDPSTWGTTQKLEDVIAQIVAHRDKDRLGMDLDLD